MPELLSRPSVLLASPWSTTHSDIARHVSEIQLPAMQQCAKVTLLGDALEMARSHGNRMPSFQGHAVMTVEQGLQTNPDGLLIVHVGNAVEQNRAALLALAQRPGIVVLHDLVMHHAWYEECIRHRSFDDYVRSVRRYYGTAVAERTMAARSDGRVVHELAKTVPLFEPFLDNALAVVVHTQMAYDGVVARGRWPVCRLDLPHPEPEGIESLMAHRRTQAESLASGEPLRLLIFGHLGTNRGLREVIQAMAQIHSLGRHALSLDIVGKVHGFDDLASVLERAGLKRHVRLHGFVPDAALDGFMHDAHLALNLRSPTMGEASGSQMRLYAAGLPSVVVDAGWYAEQPADAVLRVASALSPQDIAAIILQAMDDPRRLPRLAEAGFAQLAKHHNPEKYVQQFFQFVANAAPTGERWHVIRAHMDRVAAVSSPRDIRSWVGMGDVLAGLALPQSRDWRSFCAVQSSVPAPRASFVPAPNAKSIAELLALDVALSDSGHPMQSNPLAKSALNMPSQQDPDMVVLAHRTGPRAELPSRLLRGPLAWPRVSAFALRVWNFLSRDWREPFGLVWAILERQGNRLAHLERANRQLRQQVLDMRQAFEALQERAAPGAVAQAVAQVEASASHNAFMERLGAHFRGDPAELRRRLQVHLPQAAQAFAEARPATADASMPARRALDLGCGRGEWLALLNEAGHPAHGVDLLNECVDACASQGLSAECGDAFEVLRAVPPGSLTLVTAFHVIEHLPLEGQIRLVTDAYRALAPGGLLLLETPNPENLEVIGRNFWHDPTHQRPVPAELLRVFALAAGFDALRTTTCFLQFPDVPEAERLGYPDRLRHLLFCGQDTALYAWKA